jgi:hypothetical protein
MQVGILLGLMCKYMCEECDFQIFSSAGTYPHSNRSVELKDGMLFFFFFQIKLLSAHLAVQHSLS